MTKYRNRKTVFAGLTFDSAAEARRYGELMILERVGKIEKLQRQVAYVLAGPVKFAGSRARKPALRFIADFAYVEAGQEVVEDVKSPVSAKLAAFQIKRHLMLAVHGIDVRITP